MTDFTAKKLLSRVILRAYPLVENFAMVTIIFVFIVAVGGCGRGSKLTIVPAVGTAKYKGQPMAIANIILHPLTRGEDWDNALNPHAKVQADGSFKLTTMKPDDGAPPGDYKVEITWYAKNTPSNDPETMSGDVDRLGGKYSAAKSDLKVTVKPDQPQLEPFDLK